MPTWMRLRSTLKRLTGSFLPESLRNSLRKGYYCHLVRSVIKRGELDFPIADCLLSGGDCAIDVGANIGVYTAYLSKLVGENGSVYSVEPIPSTYELLVSNVAKLGLANVQTIHAAISDRDGMVEMHIPRGEDGFENFYRAQVVGTGSIASSSAIQVRARTLDSLLARLPERCDLIKCDVEGHEMACLNGALEIMDRFFPAWLIEVSGDPDIPADKAAQVFALLHEQGYTAYWFDGQVLHKRRRADESINYWFLGPKHVARLSKSGISIG